MWQVKEEAYMDDEGDGASNRDRCPKEIKLDVPVYVPKVCDCRVINFVRDQDCVQ